MNENKKCPHCGEPLPEAAAFCPHCAQSVNQREEVKPPRRIPRQAFYLLCALLLMAAAALVWWLTRTL